MVDMEQVEANVRPAAVAYSPDDERLLVERAGAITPRYCRVCGGCEGACSRGLDVATLVRCVSYVDGHGAFEIGGPTDGRGCRGCSATCAARNAPPARSAARTASTCASSWSGREGCSHSRRTGAVRRGRTRAAFVGRRLPRLGERRPPGCFASRREWAVDAGNGRSFRGMNGSGEQAPGGRTPDSGPGGAAPNDQGTPQRLLPPPRGIALAPPPPLR
jgi:hypothetical protein